jgi:glycosyltransferase involved in cell wall biosynthesis
MIKDKVSVILPVHYVNQQWLKLSIESVLNQDYGNFELIVVNDMATENIDDLIKSYKTIKYIKNDQQGKLAFSFNRGFESSDGEFISWVAADDYMHPKMLSRLVSEMKNHPQVSIISGRTRIIDEEGNAKNNTNYGLSIAEQYGYTYGEDILDQTYTWFSTISSCWLLKREVWARIGGFDESLYGEEDFDFWIRAAREFKIYRLPRSEEPMYSYRQHNRSISRTVPYCFNRARIRILSREQRLFPQEKGISTAIRHFQRKAFKEWKKNVVGQTRITIKQSIGTVFPGKGEPVKF